MRRRSVPMTEEEFALLPFEPGWKCEYWDGCAHYRPRHHGVVTTVAVTPRTVQTDCLLRPPTEADLPLLELLYTAAFGATIEYWECNAEQLARAARRDLRNHFAGAKAGPPHPASLVAEAGAGALVGAALLVSAENGVLLDLLFVTPARQRRGLATALVAAALNELRARGARTLTSKYHIGNEQSRAWHQRFGFIEEPDLTRARLYAEQARQELGRRARSEKLPKPEHARLAKEAARWEKEVARLARLEEEQGYEAVHPTMRW